MKKCRILYSFCFVFFMSCDSSNAGHSKNADSTVGSPVTTAAETGKYTLSVAFPALEFEQPVELTSPNDNTDRIFVLAQKGIIHVLPNKPDVKKSTVFLDISGQVESGGEKGLLGLAFHPDYKNNGFFYVNYTKGDPLETVISRFKVSASDPNVADPKSEVILLKYRQPYENHNGGKVAFGNDGFLYIAAGDGGSGGDPGNRAQNKKELLGKILRIDVNNPSGNVPYSIPADNPFKGNKDGFREEIYAYGMRNPWRFSFDRETGALWAGDVGQDKIEEVDLIEKGGNYGWHIMEADECFKSDNCDKSGLIDPIWSYHQGSETGRSVTGGYVCRDKNLGDLDGKYIFGDFVSGNIWALTYSGKKAVKNELITRLSDGLSSFGEDSNNNLYVLAYGAGKIYKITSKQ
ncbi:PQQ-dependent sugar dehydrogenase [Segetibacter koreensis]|uniref:PQQ-dependent sugar dehydrogenase n=1 Tax=Segetibacter koreensis TaxID=398037 RepID=UPI0003613DC9|nr:PQQ-dependent sugar dehydrogenase [Segetibacter koreensis]